MLQRAVCDECLGMSMTPAGAAIIRSCSAVDGVRRTPGRGNAESARLFVPRVPRSWTRCPSGARDWEVLANSNARLACGATPAHEADAGTPTRDYWSPDGARVAATCGRDTREWVGVFDAQSGTLVSDSRSWRDSGGRALPAGSVFQPAFDFTGTRIAFFGDGDGARRIMRVDVSTGMTSVAYETQTKGLAAPTWSSDGRRIVFLQRSGPPPVHETPGYDLAQLELATGSVSEILPGPNHPRNPQAIALTPSQAASIRRASCTGTPARSP